MVDPITQANSLFIRLGIIPKGMVCLSMFLSCTMPMMVHNCQNYIKSFSMKGSIAWTFSLHNRNPLREFLDGLGLHMSIVWMPF